MKEECIAKKHGKLCSQPFTWGYVYDDCFDFDGEQVCPPYIRPLKELIDLIEELLKKQEP